MDYKNPTLTEIVAELHLPQSTLPEKSIMTLARELASRGLDDQEIVNVLQVSAAEDEKETDAKIGARIRCWDKEHIKLVQISPDAVFVNLIGEYPGWDKFREHIQLTCEAIVKVLQREFEVIRVDLTTIDTWKVASEGFTIGQYLNCNGRYIPSWYSDVAVSSDIHLGQGFYNTDGFNKKINIKVRNSEGNAQFQIVTSFGVSGRRNNFDEIVAELHRESVKCFEGVITDKVRSEIMGGTV